MKAKNSQDSARIPLCWWIWRGGWVLLLLAVFFCGLTIQAAEIKIYAGGVAGISSLTNPAASATFRAAGGGLYLHNDGWAKLSLAEQRQVLNCFQGLPVGIELGFKEGAKPWANRLRDGYLALGIKPAFIAANAFDGNNHPTPEQWQKYSAALRATGLPVATLILPTFEYANFGPNLATLTNNTVSRRSDFQAMITTAGGMALDTPPAYAFQREPAYREWIFDAIRWCRRRDLAVVWITSPHTSPVTFSEDTQKFLALLKQQSALPTAIVSENYTDHVPVDFPSVVGTEDQANTTLGVAWQLLHITVPAITRGK